MDVTFYLQYSADVSSDSLPYDITIALPWQCHGIAMATRRGDTMTIDLLSN